MLPQERSAAAAKIQVLVRSFLQKRRVERRRSAAINIQAAWRGFRARKALALMKEAKLLALKNTAATTIQVCLHIDLGALCNPMFGFVHSLG